MRTETTTRTIYKFDELSDSAKDKALDNCRYYEVDHDWWEYTYEDASEVGIKITSFDIDRASYCNGEIPDTEQTAHNIVDNHGEVCDTYKVAAAYLKERDEAIKAAPKDEDGEFEDEYELDQKLDELGEEFKKAILEEYLSILRKEYEYLTSDEAVKEMIEANEYEFTEEGERA